MYPYDKDPDFINEEGTKWWRDESITQYAQKEDIHGTSLDAVCFYIELSDGYKTRVLVSRISEEVIEEDQTLEGMGTKIDIRKFLKRAEENKCLRN